MLVLKSTYDRLREQNEELEEKLMAERKANMQKKQQLEESDSEIERLNQVITDMSTKSDKNEVRLVISDDLQSVTPFFRFKESAADYLMQGGYINQQSDHAIQLGLMLIATEAFEQIIEASSGSIKTDS